VKNIKLKKVNSASEQITGGLVVVGVGNGPPSLRCVVGLGDRSTTSELRQGPSLYGGQQ